ncbi:hypothetical protein ACS0TY_028616 [Phlomoides rotata]
MNYAALPVHDKRRFGCIDLEYPNKLGMYAESSKCDRGRHRFTSIIDAELSNEGCSILFRDYIFLLKNSRRGRGLVDGKHEEQVAMSMEKNMIVKFNFLRSGETVSRYVHLVLKVILKIYSLLLSRLVPVLNNSTNSRWKWFKGCLGALNGTYISGQVPIDEK